MDCLSKSDPRCGSQFEKMEGFGEENEVANDGKVVQELFFNLIESGIEDFIKLNKKVLILLVNFLFLYNHINFNV